VDADLILRWMSETGSGSISHLRERLAWLAHTGDTPTSRTATGRWLTDISALGHAEVDWQADRWSVALPVITPLPCSDGTAVLAGSRRTGLLERLEQADVSVSTYVPPAGAGGLRVPRVVFLQYDDLDGLTAAAHESGLTYSACAARKLAERLPPLHLGGEAPPPAYGNPTLQRFNYDELAFRPSGADRDGLYRVRLHGVVRHLYRQNGTWHNCDLATGIFIEYAGSVGVSVIRFREERGYPGGPVGSVFIDRGAPLPALHARALTLCSGLPPRFSETARMTTYGNVPAIVASAVAGSLQQRLQHC
jgi:hypothetical protein